MTMSHCLRLQRAEAGVELNLHLMRTLLERIPDFLTSPNLGQ